MLLQAAKFDPTKIRGYFGGAVLPSLVTAVFIFIGVIGLLFGWGMEKPDLSMAGIVAFCMLGLLTWLAALKRYRIIADTPTTLLRSAAQGYVEVTGTCRAIPFADLLCTGGAPPCVWYFATIHKKKSRSGEDHTYFVRSDERFLIEDGTGECVIDPEHAEVLSAHRISWEDAHGYYKMSYLLPGDRLYAIGDMRTLRVADGSFTDSADLSAVLRREWNRERRSAERGAVLREWKRDRAALVQRFDSDGDGDIDLKEWQGAVAAAEREVDVGHWETRLKPGLHMLRAPGDGRPFLLSNGDPDELRRRYQCWAWIHLTVFIATFAWGAAALLNRAQ